MRKFIPISILLVIIASLSSVGFQCGSAESTSAKLYIQRGEYDKAEAALLKDVEKAPDNAESWYYLGNVRLRTRNYPGVIEAFDKCLSLPAGKEWESKITDDKRILWQSSLNAGVIAYNNSMKTSPDSAKMVLESAIESYKVALIANPDSAITYQNLAIAYHAQGNTDEEIRVLKQSIERKKDPQFFSYLVNAYVTKAEEAKKANNKAEADANFNNAIASLTEARALDPDNQELLSTLIDVYIGAGRAADALPFLKEAVQKNPTNKVFQNDLGLLLLQTNDLTGAVEHFSAAIAADSSFLDGLRNGSIALMKLGQQMKDEASAKADPKQGITDKSYQEKFKGAAQLLRKYLSIKDGDPDIYEALATAYGGAGRVKDAQEALMKADELRKK